MTDGTIAYANGINQASRIFNDVLNEYVAENDKLRKLVTDMYRDISAAYVEGRPLAPYAYDERMEALGIEVD